MTLFLDNNQIGDKGAEYLGEGLQQNKVRQRRAFSSSLSYSLILLDTDTYQTRSLQQSNRQ